jgi:hypothetical protein
MANRVYGAVDAVTNFNIATPPESWGRGRYQSPTQASYDDNLNSYYEARRQKQERQRQNAEQQASRSAAMARLHLDEVTQQQTLTPTPQSRRVKSKQYTPESQ